MTEYTNKEKNIFFINDENIIKIDVTENNKQKVLIIDNLPNVESICLSSILDVYISITNCPKLVKVYVNCIHNIGYEHHGKYLYLGENLNSLKHVSIIDFNTVKFEDQVLYNLEYLKFRSVRKLICDFDNFVNLKTLKLQKIKFEEDIIFDLENVLSFTLSICSFQTLELINNEHLKKFKFYHNEYKSLKAENPISTSELVISNDYKSDMVVPYLPLCNDITEELSFYIFKKNLYDYRYNFFIENNKSKIKLIDQLSKKEVPLHKMKFKYVKKKSARK